MTDEEKRNAVSMMLAKYPELAEKYKNVKYSDLEDHDLDAFYTEVKDVYEKFDPWHLEEFEPDEKKLK